MTSSKTNNMHQSWCPRQGLELTAELTRTLHASQTFVSNSWANSNRNCFFAFYSLCNTQRFSLRTESWLKRLRKIGHNTKERRVLRNREETIMGDTVGTKFQHGGEDWNNRFLFAWQCWSSWNHKLSEAIWRRRIRRRNKRWEDCLQRSSPTFQQIFKEVSLNEKIKDWSETQSRNQQLGENEQSRKEYVWLFWVQLMGEKRSLNLSVVRSLTVTLALASSTIVLPEVFPFGRSKENNCFHHLLFQFQDSDSTPAVSTPYFTSMVHLTFSPSPIPQPFPLFWALQNSLHQTIFSPNSFFLPFGYLS